MQMPDGEIIPLPADDRGLTLFPEIGQERHWSIMSYPLDAEELCELIMSRERIRRMRASMPDPASDAVMPTANEESTALEETSVSEVADIPAEASTGSIDERTSVPSTGLTDFTVLTECSVCQFTALTATWVWQKSKRLTADGIVDDRSAQTLLPGEMVLQSTVICEVCYTIVVLDGGMRIDGEWWIIEAKDADPLLRGGSCPAQCEHIYQGPLAEQGGCNASADALGGQLELLQRF